MIPLIPLIPGIFHGPDTTPTPVPSTPEAPVEPSTVPPVTTVPQEDQPAKSGGSRGQLANTGADVSVLLGLAVALIVAGAGFAAVRRKEN
ncbi:LPXTG cell wall anchor domain-containing protein [uncultured Corynebacterium sp.]|uniref:LPXTG cell wall anchor domain-containing protein n=1 Tax=uncultured Corynebacterium sp. TaxID=159447 RepID=UPI0025EAF5F7|nr:LPXTG cell wall anchor domain-containing protein [uncultured Corynebacterium sp.]